MNLKQKILTESELPRGFKASQTKGYDAFKFLSIPHPKSDGDFIVPETVFLKRWSARLSKIFGEDVPLNGMKRKNMIKGYQTSFDFRLKNGDTYTIEKTGENSKSSQYWVGRKIKKAK